MEDPAVLGNTEGILEHVALLAQTVSIGCIVLGCPTNTIRNLPPPFRMLTLRGQVNKLGLFGFGHSLAVMLCLDICQERFV